MYELIVFILSPVIACYFCKTQDFINEIRRWEIFLTRFIFFFIIDNIVILLSITLVKGKINIIESMKENTRFTVFYIIVSALIGSITGIIYKLINEKRISMVIRGNNLRYLRTIETITNFFPVLLAVISGIITIFQCIDNNFWGDESYTILMVNGARNFKEVATCDLANPPFFFLILKLLTVLLGETYWVYHLVSALPTILLLIFSATCIKDKFGSGASCIFTLFMTMTSTGRSYAVEVRMYAWASMFMVFCFYEGYMLLETRGKKILNWIFFCIAGLGASYSHYFAFASVILLYFFVLIRLFIADRKNYFKCIMAIGTLVLGYLPWITIFISAVSQISNSFWIASTVSIREGFLYIFEIKLILYIYVFTIIVSAIHIYRIIYLERKENSKWEIFFCSGRKADDGVVWMGLSGIFTALIIFAFEITYGTIISPVFVARYIYPLAVAIWLSFAMLIGSIGNKGLKRIFSLILIIIMIVSYGNSFILQIRDYYRQNKSTLETINIVKDFAEYKNIRILTDNTHYMWTVFRYYFPGIQYGWLDEGLEYDFLKEDAADIVLVFANEEINERLYEQNIGGKSEFIQESFFADSHYFLYKISLNVEERDEKAY